LLADLDVHDNPSALSVNPRVFRIFRYSAGLPRVSFFRGVE